MARVQIFLSTVSAEFGSYRDALRRYLTRPNVSVAVQEDFVATGTETLDMLDEYIRQCDAVIHLVGDMSGALAQPPSLTLIRGRYPDLGEKLPPLAPLLLPGALALSYTQWEGWLALYHGRPLIVAVPEASAPRDGCFEDVPEQRAAQQAHLQRLANVERYPGIRFASPELLAVEVWRSKLFDIFVAAGTARRVVHLPYPSLGELFKGRQGVLETLLASLTNAPPTGAGAVVGNALYGLGGVGKTRLAVEYAWRQVDEYTALLFVGAESPEALGRNLAALGAPALLDLPEHQVEEEEAARVDAVLGWLRRNPGWLLIVDSADTETAARAVEALLPRLPGGHVLITSRLSNWSGGVKTLPLDVLQAQDASAFLLARTDVRRRKGDDDAAHARELAGELGGLALALEQAGAFIAQRRLTLAAYLELWRGQRDKVLTWHDPRLMQYPRSVAVTWRTSFDQLGASARRLFQRLAWLATAPIPETLLKVSVPGVAADDDPYAALAELDAYSLVNRADVEPRFTVHRLVQAVTRQEAGMLALTEALGWVDAAFAGDPLDVHTWPVLDPLLPHALEVADQADTAGIAEPTSQLMGRIALRLFEMARYREAEPLMRRALAITETRVGVGHPDVTFQLGHLAQLLKATNRLAEAEPLMRKSLAITEKYFGAEHLHFASEISNLASLLHDTGRFAEAEPLMRRALAIDENNLGAEHADVAVRLNNLAQLLQDTNRLAEAEPLMRRALAIVEKRFGSEHPHRAIHLNNLAQLLRATNRVVEAEPLMRQAVAISETSFGAEHPHVATNLNNLAQLLAETNRLSEAESLMRRAAAIVEMTFGAEHPNFARSLDNVAQLLCAADRIAEAEPLMRRALAIDERSFGPEHPKVAIHLNNLAQLLKATDRMAEAEPLMRRALAIDEKFYGAEHPNVARNLNNLAQLLKAADRMAEAEPLMRRALAIDEMSFGAAHPNVARRLSNLAHLLLVTDRVVEVESLLRRALAIDEKSLGAEHPKVAERLHSLAMVLAANKRAAEAESLVRRALAIDEKILGTEHPNVARELSTLAYVLKATNRLAEAEPLMRRAVTILYVRLGASHPNTHVVIDNYASLLGRMGLGMEEVQERIRSLLRGLPDHGTP